MAKGTLIPRAGRPTLFISSKFTFQKWNSASLAYKCAFSALHVQWQRAGFLHYIHFLIFYGKM